MSIMGSLYPEINKPGNSREDKSEMLMGNEGQVLTSHSSIPTKVAKQDVLALSKDVGSLEGDVLLMKLWSEQALSAQSTALTALDVRVNHAQQSMKNEQSYRKKIAKHGKNVSESRLINQATQANFDGYQSALQSANETIAI